MRDDVTKDFIVGTWIQLGWSNAYVLW